MKPSITTILLLAGLAIPSAVPAAAQESPDVHGVDLQVELRSGQSVRGELLAVSVDSLFLADPIGYRGFRLSDVSDARIPQRGLTGRKIMLWTLIGGALSAIGMTAACSSVSDGCGSVAASVGFSWLVVGGISAVYTGPSTRQIGTNRATLSRYARFPQGLPEGY